MSGNHKLKDGYVQKSQFELRKEATDDDPFEEITNRG